MSKINRQGNGSASINGRSSTRPTDRIAFICAPKPFFSVVIPVHNKAPYLDRSIGSVIKQRFTDFELLLIDDASTDSSLAELQKFEDPRIRILHRDAPGPGGYAARNLGVMEAEADWVAFLDADDEWCPEHLETLHKLASLPQSQVVATGWFSADGARGERIPSAFSACYEGQAFVYLDFARFLDEYMEKRRPVWTGVVAAERVLLNAVGGFPEHCRRGGDSALWLKLVAGAGGIYVATARTAAYHKDASGVIRALPAEVQRNCVFEATQELLRQVRSTVMRKQLMRVSNLSVLPGMKSRALAGRLTFRDCRQYYFWVDWATHIMFRVHSLLPGPLQPRVWRLYQKLKQLV